MRDEVDRRVGKFVDDLYAGRLRREVLAVVVSGSAAREEERWTGGELASDIDVMVIGRSSRWRVDRTRAVERILARHAADGLEGGRVPASTLHYATLANYEARHRGVAVAGDPAVLTQIPLEGPADLPDWEALRLLANRMFEHLKQMAGMASEETVVLKSYEAIGEAQLVLERRYQPSFRERMAEIERKPLEGPVAAAGELYDRAVRIRFGETVGMGVGAEEARSDLLVALQESLRQITAQDGIKRAFALLARRERHIAHRFYWMMRAFNLREFSYRPTEDPIIALWRSAATACSEGPAPSDPARLVELWKQCPQILRTATPR